MPQPIPAAVNSPKSLQRMKISGFKNMHKCGRGRLKIFKNQCYHLDDDRIAHLSPVDQDDVLFLRRKSTPLQKRYKISKDQLKTKRKRARRNRSKKKTNQRKSCNEAKASIDPVDLSLFQFNEDCSIAYYDSSKEKIVTLLDVKSFNTFLTSVLAIWSAAFKKRFPDSRFF